MSWKLNRKKRKKPANKRPKFPSPILYLELLEKRWLPTTTWTVVNTTDSSTGSLRDLIDNHAVNGDKIVFDSSLSGQTILLTTGQLEINKSLTIDGGSVGNIKVFHSISSANDRVFKIDSGNTVILSGLDIEYGSTTDDGWSTTAMVTASGGGIYSSGPLTLQNTLVENNHAEGMATSDGGGICVTNDTTISSCTFYENEARALDETNENSATHISGYGGNILNDGGTLSISDCIIANGFVGAEDIPTYGVAGSASGGAICAGVSLLAPNATLSITDSLIQNNEVLARSIPEGYGNGFGGGIYSSSNINLTRVSIENNDAQGNYPEILEFSDEPPTYYGFGGGLYATDPTTTTTTTTITQVTFNGNTVEGREADGAGMYLAAHASFITNATVSDNTAHAVDDTATDAFGGGIAAMDGTVQIKYTTIAGNVVDATAIGAYAGPRGGGLYVATTTLVGSTILSGNTFTEGPTSIFGPPRHNRHQ
jgi:hypothetical protein